MTTKYSYERENGYWQVYVNTMRSSRYHREEHAHLDAVLSQNYVDMCARKFGGPEQKKLDLFLTIIRIMRERGMEA